MYAAQLLTCILRIISPFLNVLPTHCLIKYVMDNPAFYEQKQNGFVVNTDTSTGCTLIVTISNDSMVTLLDTGNSFETVWLVKSRSNIVPSKISMT